MREFSAVELSINMEELRMRLIDYWCTYVDDLVPGKTVGANALCMGSGFGLVGNRLL